MKSGKNTAGGENTASSISQIGGDTPQPERVANILLLLDKHYPQQDKCYLSYAKDYELLFATILSAQCTDDRVNMITGGLFAKHRSLEAFAALPQAELEAEIKSAGYYRSKAKNIIRSAKALLEKHGGAVPRDIGELTALPGVGRKTANVIRGHIWAEPSIVVDTHVMRISNRLGLVSSDDPVKIEFALMEILPKDHWIRYNTQIIAHGRAICKAQKPKCGECFLFPYCESRG
jgi:endonuclease-3